MARLKPVVNFLRSKIADFDNVPDMFAGLGEDELLRSFVGDKRESNFYTWNIRPSEISPLLKVSIEFAKAKYEDKAFQIEFDWQVVGRLKSGDTNIIAAFRRVDDAKTVGERTTVRLPYDSLPAICTDNELVRISRLCGQEFHYRSAAPRHTLPDKATINEEISETGVLRA